MRPKTFDDLVLFACAAIITAIVTMYGFVIRDVRIAGYDFLLFLVSMAGALFIMRTVIRLFDDLISHRRRRNR